MWLKPFFWRGQDVSKVGSERFPVKPILRRLLFCVLLMIVSIVSIAGLLLVGQYRAEIEGRMATVDKEIFSELQTNLNHQAVKLELLVRAIAMRTEVGKAIESGDREQLLADWEPLFSTMQQKNGITHLSFLDRERKMVLRMHYPSQYGDRIDRLTMKEAEQTGETAVGLDLGPFSAFTLRVVQPVLRRGEVIGFVEIGREIGKILEEKHQRTGIQLALAIEKKYLLKEPWEVSMQLLHKDANWDRFPRHTLVYTSQPVLSQTLEGMLGDSDKPPVARHSEIEYGGKRWYVSSIPFCGVGGRVMGSLLLMSDLTEHEKAFFNVLWRGGLVAGILLMILSIGLVRLVRGADAQIRQQEAELREGDDRMDLVMQATRDGLWDWDIVGDQVYLNEAYHAMIEESPRVLPRSHQEWIECVHPEDKERYREAIESHLAGVTSIMDQEYRVRREDGSWLWLRGRGKVVARDASGHALRMVGMVTDIAERKQTEERLRHTKELLRTRLKISQAMHEMSLDEMLQHTLDLAEKMTGSSIAFYHFVGEDQEKITLQTWSTNTLQSMCRAEGKGMHYPKSKAGIWARCMETKEPVVINDYASDMAKKGLPEGHAPVTRLISLPILREGVIKAIVGVGNKAEDYTQQDVETLSEIAESLWDAVGHKQARLDLEERMTQLQEAREQADEANRAKSAFLSMMSHEIRTPMNSIIGFADLLSQDIQDPQQQDFIQTIQSCGHDLLHLINDILDYSKMEAGKMVVESIPCHLSDIVGAICAQHALKAHEKGLQLAHTIANQIPACVLSDPARIKQILNNLLSNAIKFTHAGSVSLSLDVKAADQEGQVWLSFAVRDTGIGIGKEQAGRLFQPFAQADNSTSRKFGGSGLGLVICKKICEMMGGSISMESEIGKGSTFTARILAPLHEQPTMSVLQTEDGRGGEPRRLRVLLFEDDPMSQKLLAAQLARHSVILTPAADAKVGFEWLERYPFDVILMDIRMPDLDGHQAARLIRRREAERHSPRIPIIAVTADALPGDRQKCLDSGMDDYISKPIDFALLLQILHQWTQARSESPA